MLEQIGGAVQGSVRPSLSIVWSMADGTAMNLTGATLTGSIRSLAGVERPIVGALVITGASTGAFRWDLDADDVAEAGTFTVQIEAAFLAGATPARSEPALWVVIESQL